VWRSCLLALAACSAPAISSHAPAPAPHDDLIDRRLGDPTWHVPGSIDAIAFAHGEQRIVVGSQQGGVIVYDLASGAIVSRARRLGQLHTMSLTDDDHAIVSAYRSGGDDSGTVRIDLARGTASSIAGLADTIVIPRAPSTGIAAHDDGLAVVSLADGSIVRALDRSTGYEHPIVIGARAIASRRWATGVWELATGARVARFGAPSVAALSPDGATIATGAFRDKGGLMVDVYDVASGARLQSFAHGDCAPHAATFSPDARWLAIACDDGVRVWDLRAGGLVAALDARMFFARTIVFAPSGRWLAAGGGDGVLHVWDTRSWTERPIGDAQHGEIHAIAISDDGARVLTRSNLDRDVRLWNVRSGRAILLATGRDAQAAAISGRGALIATSDPDGAWIERRRADGTRAEVRAIGKGGYGSPLVRAIASAPGGAAIAIWSGAVHAFDAHLEPSWTSRPVVAGDYGNGEVAITRDGASVAIAGEHGELMIVDTRAQKARDLSARGCHGVAALAWSADATRLALVDGDDALRVIDAATGEQVLAVTLPSGARDLAIARDGHVLALASSDDDEDVVYDVDPRGALTKVPASDASAMALSRDGASIWLGLRDGTLARIPRDRIARLATAIPAGDPPPAIDACPARDEGTGYGWGGGEQRGKLSDDVAEPPIGPP